MIRIWLWYYYWLLFETNIKGTHEHYRLCPITFNCDDLRYFSYVVFYDICLWDMHLGHLNFESLNFLTKRNMVYGLSSIDFSAKPCESCILEKKHRDLVPKGKTLWASQLLELIHFWPVLSWATFHQWSKIFCYLHWWF